MIPKSKVAELMKNSCEAGKAMLLADWDESKKETSIWLCGDFTGLMNIICGTIERLSSKMGIPYDQMLSDMQMALDFSKKPKTVLDGETMGLEEYEAERMELARKEVTEQMERKYGFEIKALKKEQNRLNSEIVARDSTIKALREKVESVRKAGSDDIAQLQRELRQKENEIRRLLKEREESMGDTWD